MKRLRAGIIETLVSAGVQYSRTMARFVGHLPLVRLAAGATRLPARHGQFRALGYDEWYAADGHFAYSQRQYEQTSPCFLELELGDRGSSEEAAEAFESGADDATTDLGLCHQALMLVTGARLPLPALSVAYLVLEGQDLPEELRDVVVATQLRRVGPAERELIVHGAQQQQETLDEATCAEVDRIWSYLETVGTEIEPALEALARTARPGFTALNETLHLVAGLEAVLVARGEPLTETFARRYAVLATDNEISSIYEHARYLYRLRSDVVHGRPSPRLTPEWEEFLQTQHRLWTCLILRRVLCWFATSEKAGPEDLRAALDRAWDSPEVLAELRATWGASGE